MKNLQFNTKLFWITALLWFASCRSAPNRNSGEFDLNALVGRWEHAENKNNQYEEWVLISGNELRGKGFVLEKGDTTFIEALTIKKENGVVVYTAEAGDQNDGEKVPFQLEAQSEKTIEFANYYHDFPQRIVYEIKSDSTMQAYIEGPRNGQKIRIVFDYIRRK